MPCVKYVSMSDVHHGPFDLLVCFKIGNETRYAVVEVTVTTVFHDGNSLQFNTRKSGRKDWANMLLTFFVQHAQNPTDNCCVSSFNAQACNPGTRTPTLKTNVSLSKLKGSGVGKILTGSPTTHQILHINNVGQNATPVIDTKAAEQAKKLVHGLKWFPNLNKTIFPSPSVVKPPPLS